MGRFSQSTNVLYLLLAALGGCATESTVCRVGADCASGLCRDDGTCAPVPGDGGDLLDDGASRPDASGPRPDSAGACVPNDDAIIERREVVLQAGLRANFRTAFDVSFSTAGQTAQGGDRVWDLSVSFSGDKDVLTETLALDGWWFASTYPGASYVSRLSAKEDTDLLGIFEVTSEALLLRGLASPEMGLSRTELVYDPPVPVLSFPLTAGKEWETTSIVTGTFQGTPLGVAIIETYASKVDAEGTVKTPFGEFPVVRVGTTLWRNAFGVQTRIRSYAFVSECFGTVALVSSRENEPGNEFETASELKRLAP